MCWGPSGEFNVAPAVYILWVGVKKYILMNKYVVTNYAKDVITVQKYLGRKRFL